MTRSQRARQIQEQIGRLKAELAELNSPLTVTVRLDERCPAFNTGDAVILGYDDPDKNSLYCGTILRVRRPQ